MAYNREWDRGKDSWAHSNQWSTQDSRATVRGREEDYTGDGKRRKFNNGVRGVLPTFYVSLHPITQGLRRYPKLWGFFFIRTFIQPTKRLVSRLWTRGTVSSKWPSGFSQETSGAFRAESPRYLPWFGSRLHRGRCLSTPMFLNIVISMTEVVSYPASGISCFQWLQCWNRDYYPREIIRHLQLCICFCTCINHLRLGVL